jgi:hypothetical protein
MFLKRKRIQMMELEEGIVFILSNNDKLKSSEILDIADRTGIWNASEDIRQDLIEVLQNLKNREKIVRYFDSENEWWYFSLIQ